MIITTVLCILTGLLWDYAARTGHRRLLLFADLVLSILSAVGLAHYEEIFPSLAASGWDGLYDWKAMAGLIWLLAAILAFPFLLLVDALSLPFRTRRRRRRRRRRRGGVSRRTFLKGAAALLPAASLATSGAGNLLGERDLDTTYHLLKYKNLPDYLDGYKIGQLSDLHMGLFFSPRRLQEAIDAVAAQGVNRLEITGDLIDELSLLPQAQAIIAANADRFPDGIDFCYGNHEYYRDFDAITAMLEKTPVRILRNSSFRASRGCGQGLQGCRGRDGRSFYIVAADYSFARGDSAFAAEREEYVQKALDGVPEDAFVVMLAHHSAFIDEGFKHHIPLTLCGHTHGAQFAPIGPLVTALGFKYLRGMFQHGEYRGYVNRGTGHWLPFRILCSREASVFELRKQA
ncbi:metallophosphoesterase [uncultured Megasphaera sp.]|uniref:metallophosphoesterase n=1 Tax=uncultured Megasphaera sp. TaxID=165188 RepID=UPI0025E6050F|nr:metallophosphoesterase [uncultured Megasphaera sp.]